MHKVQVLTLEEIVASFDLLRQAKAIMVKCILHEVDLHLLSVHISLMNLKQQALGQIQGQSEITKESGKMNNYYHYTFQVFQTSLSHFLFSMLGVLTNIQLIYHSTKDC